MIRRYLLLFGVLLPGFCEAAEPQWIWRKAKDTENVTLFFRKVFEVENPESARIEITCDNKYALFLNGQNVGAGNNWNQIDAFDVSKRIVKGKNIINVMGINEGGPGGLVVRVVVNEMGKTEPLTFSSDKTWKFSTTRHPKWRDPEWDDAEWNESAELGEIGKTDPWGAQPKIQEATAEPVFVRMDRPNGPFQFLDGDRVAFLGDTLIERASRDDLIETFITRRYPDRKIVFRNLGWSADNVFGESRAGFGSVEDGFRALTNQIYEFRPTVIIVGYGAADSSAGIEGLDRFRAGLNQLIDALERTQAEILFLTPILQESTDPKITADPSANANRIAYGRALQEIALERGKEAHNFQSKLYLGLSDPQEHLTENGIHLNPRGYWRLGALISRELTGQPVKWKVEIKVGEEPKALGTKLSETESNSKQVRFSTSDEHLPAPPGMEHDHAIFGETRSLIVKGLSTGSYDLLIDDQRVGTYEASALSSGVMLTSGPEFDQVEMLRKRVQKKNEFFFHRWRPQNETYLFGFRKHEQGQNAKEIPEFDPIVEKVEEEIRELKTPKPHRYELRPAERE